MIDVVSPEVRSRMMSGIKGTNTRPELLLRSGLHAKGFRYRLHVKGLPGKPDLVFPKYNAVIFAHGCFWHGHNCHLFKWPQSRKKFWRSKIERNQFVDRRSFNQLIDNGWRVGIVWECATKGKHKRSANEIIDKCAKWLRSRNRIFELCYLGN